MQVEHDPDELCAHGKESRRNAATIQLFHYGDSFPLKIMTHNGWEIQKS